MPDAKVRTPPPLANAIRRLLRRHGVSERAMAKLLGRGKTWVSDTLRGRNPLTFEAAEQIAAHFDLSLRDLLAEAYPNPADPLVSPYALLADLAPEAEERALPTDLRDDLEEVLCHEPKVQSVEPPNYDILRGIQNSVWVDRSRVTDYAMFHLTDALKPRHVHTFIGGLAILSDVLRARRSVDLYHRGRLLLRAHELLETHPHPNIAALVTEKTAYYCWDLTCNAQIGSNLLEHPKTIFHPFPDHLFACRAQFHMIREQSEEAMVYVNLVLSLSDVDQGIEGSAMIPDGPTLISEASVHTIAANVYANQGAPSKGLAHVVEALALPDLPLHLRINLEAEAARLQILLGNSAPALDTFLRIIKNRTYCKTWLVKAAYVALDLLAANPPGRLLKEALPHILWIQANLDPQQKIEAAVLHSLAPHVAIATATSPLGQQKKDVDPNG